MRLNLALLHNDDADCLAEDPGREARKDVENVAAALAEALASRGHAVRVIAASADLQFVAKLRAHPADLVINLCESLAGDARGEMVIPGLLEMIGQPYTGSPALALGTALHKDRAKQVLRGHAVSTPASVAIERLEQLPLLAGGQHGFAAHGGLGLLEDGELRWPLIVKPAREDASTCIDFDSVARDRAGLSRAVERVLRTLHQPALVEQYVEGQEIYVPILGNSPRRALPLTEIQYGDYFEGRPRIVSYKAKWDAESPEWKATSVAAARLSPSVEAGCVRAAFAAFEALGCRDYGRVDLRVDASGTPWVIDVNPNCDLHPAAGFANTARSSGMSYAELAEQLVKIALDRSGSHRAHAPALRPVSPLGESIAVA